METTTLIIILIYQYIILLTFYFTYNLILKYIAPVRRSTWVCLFIPVFGMFFGVFKMMVFAIKD